MKNYILFLVLILLQTSLFGQLKQDEVGALTGVAVITSAYPDYTIRASFVSSNGYLIANIDPSTDSIYVAFENSLTSPKSVAILKVTAISVVAGQQADFTCESSRGTNITSFPATGILFKSDANNNDLTLLDGGISENLKMNMINHNVLLLDSLINGITPLDSMTAGNLLTKSGNEIKLGGTADAATTLNTSIYNFNIDRTLGNFNVFGQYGLDYGSFGTGRLNTNIVHYNSTHSVQSRITPDSFLVKWAIPTTNRFKITPDTMYWNGAVKLENYGASAVGTPAYALGVDADGDLTTSEVGASSMDTAITHAYLREFRNAVSSTDTFEVVLLGDSRTASYHTGLQLIYRLDRQFDFGGIGYLSFGDVTPTFIGGTNNGGTVNDITGTGVQSTSGLSLTLDDTGDDYTISTSGDYGEFSKIDVWYYQQTGGGDFTITIDGVINQTVSTDGAESVQKVSISGLSDSTHTIVFERTTAGNVDLLEMYLRKETGFVVNVIGNSGANTGNFVNDVTNVHFYESTSPDLVIIRLGVNGNDIDSPQAGADNHETITNNILAVSPNSNFVWTGEPDNDGGDAANDIQDYNAVIFAKADSNNVAFFDMFEVIPDWTDFYDGGFGDAVTHENEKGGQILADWYYEKIFSSNWENPVQSGIAAGTSNRLAYYSSTDQLSSATNIYADADKIGIGTTGNGSGKLNVKQNNGVISALGYGANGANPFFTINDKNGYADLTWFAKYDGSNYLSTIALTPIQLARSSTQLKINFADATTVGDAVSWTTNLTMDADGLLQLPGYNSSNYSNIDAGTTWTYPVFDSNGYLRPRTAEDYFAPFGFLNPDSLTGQDKKIISMGTYANASNPLFSYNDVGGLSHWTSMAKYDTDSSAFVSTYAALAPLRWYREATKYHIAFADVTTAGNVINTWDNVFTAHKSGLLQFGNYGAGSNTGTETYQLAVTSTGDVVEQAITKEFARVFIHPDSNLTASSYTDIKFTVPPRLNGYTLVGFDAAVNTASDADFYMNLQVDPTASGAVNLTNITMSANTTTASQTLSRVMTTGDVIRVYVNSISGSTPAGLEGYFVFEK